MQLLDYQSNQTGAQQEVSEIHREIPAGPFSSSEMNSMVFCGSRLVWNSTQPFDFQPIFHGIEPSVNFTK